ncbi:hypothetical protein VII00023_07234 [Vibrio ichthyoenteri ATCC 700023]|uniref:Uncharacterized protein n=1 Tax=Vibrio ichthyoenteri ATCC 700023 TaxID=870968 RepID=F9S2V8_9VIBR|nr:hypothetical protein [Vibrio ichthyoenteri]EGU38832.1 hypothetical protein VII00023_07234 [Vibrio ichthyoenteri ATCC 700023]
MPKNKVRKRKNKNGVYRPVSPVTRRRRDADFEIGLFGALKILEDAKKVPFMEIERPTVGVYRDNLDVEHDVIEVSERELDGNFSVTIQNDELGQHKTDAYGWFVRLVGMDYQRKTNMDNGGG